jgi:hypothetical protein
VPGFVGNDLLGSPTVNTRNAYTYDWCVRRACTSPA